MSTAGSLQARVRAFDLARGLAVLFMIAVHVLWHWGAPATWDTPVGVAISLLGGPTAMPVFMFLMGASLAFSTRTSFRELVGRGLWLVFLGYLLNVLRGALPATLGLEFGVVTADEIAPFTPWWLLTTVDVHQMAGSALIALALLRLVGPPGWGWIALAGFVGATAPLVRGAAFGTPLLDAPLTPVLGGAPNVYYAVFPWLVYPLVGGVFGAVLARSSVRATVFRRGALVGVALCAVAAAWLAFDPPAFDVSTYWQNPPVYLVGITGLVLVWLWLCDLAVRRIPPNDAFEVVYGWSGRVIGMYFTHWLVVGWGVGLVGFRRLELAPVLVAIVVVVALTSWLSRPRAGTAFLGRLHAPWQRVRPRPAGPAGG